MPGQLVRVDKMTAVSGVELQSSPSNAVDFMIVGRLSTNDVAIVISTFRNNASVYVLGPTGGGWTFGAQLVAVQ